MSKNFPVDIVYLWCDGQESEFKKRRNEYLKQEHVLFNEENVGEKRFIENDELKYSLRSLEMYASWIHHVYIVTDRQIPKWLNQYNKKITIIDHATIVPQKLIPCFNSSVIERYIAFIPNLSEHFLYANDDTFFNEPVSRSFFFADDGYPINRMLNLEGYAKIVSKEYLETRYKNESEWTKTIIQAWMIINQQYGSHVIYQPYHNIDAYIKSEYVKTFIRYGDLFALHQHRFRQNDDIERCIFNLDLVYQNKGVLKIVKQPSYWRKRFFWLKNIKLENYCGCEGRKAFFAINHFKPSVFCLNAKTNATCNEKKQTRNFLEKHFPEKSNFEI
jgi:hypothetical protein